MPEAALFGVFGGVFGGLAVVVWWAFFSRAPRSERWGAIVLMIVALAATPRVLHESVATAGMGMMPFLYIIPVLSLAFVVWAVAGRGLADAPRRVTMVATILLACGVWTLVRSDGMTGDGSLDLAWRWTQTPEERLLARAGDAPPALPKAPAATNTGADWARLSRRGSRRQHSGCADRDRLVRVAAGRVVAPVDRTGHLVLRGQRRPPLHPGAAW